MGYKLLAHIIVTSLVKMAKVTDIYKMLWQVDEVGTIVTWDFYVH
jgi:hypothetical protein